MLEEEDDERQQLASSCVKTIFGALATSLCVVDALRETKPSLLIWQPMAVNPFLSYDIVLGCLEIQEMWPSEY